MQICRTVNVLRVVVDPDLKDRGLWVSDNQVESPVLQTVFVGPTGLVLVRGGGGGFGGEGTGKMRLVLA